MACGPETLITERPARPGAEERAKTVEARSSLSASRALVAMILLEERKEEALRGMVEERGRDEEREERMERKEGEEEMKVLLRPEAASLRRAPTARRFIANRETWKSLNGRTNRLGEHGTPSFLSFPALQNLSSPPLPPPSLGFGSLRTNAVHQALPSSEKQPELCARINEHFKQRDCTRAWGRGPGRGGRVPRSRVL